ncbi:hypothetical protein EIP91_009682 [Steccherinum ochraceum]|uniref:Uncharacterized protein n=1 Tax=Steccherinum ochraceum TaxID=92696 RepID=A0A4R0RRD9_9APHY|nr:hypothetical protein EIP91_009682 [Steccherinum ochraceum]
MPAPESLAVKLKNEGNALFAKKDYQAAHHKYSLAIKEDEKNAVLYANRAACSQNLRKFLDASADAKRATVLDSTYAKGWARLAAAEASLGNEKDSIESWKKAIGCLPKENQTPAEMKQKEQYQSELATVERKLNRSENTRPQPTVVRQSEAVPWKRAAAMVAELRSRPGQLTSSAFVILEAWNEWQEGMNTLNSQRNMPGGATMGNTGGLESLTNAIVRDQRIFHMTHNFIGKYNNQVRLEAQTRNAWVEGGTEIIIPEVIKRQQLHGWDSVRPAITVTIRCFLMRGFMESHTRGNGAGGVEFVGRALEILRWGHRTWKHVPQDDKGAIFSDSFMYGAHGLYLDILMQACGGNQRKYLDMLHEEAQALLRSDVPNISPFLGPGFVASFTTYPRGTAYSMIGFYHSQTAEKLVASKSEDSAAIYQHFQDAAKAYGSAADCFSQDDEKHVWMLFCSLMNWYSCGATLKTTLPLMQKIRERLPGVKKIWDNASLFKESARHFKRALDFEEDVQKALDQGTVNMDSRVMPDDLKVRLPAGATSPTPV